MNSASPSTAWTSWRQQAQSRWHSLAERERRLLGVALTVVGVALIWWLLVLPVWRAAQEVPAQQAQAQFDVLWMQRDGAQVRKLQEVPAVPAAQAQMLLKSSVEALGGKATLEASGDTATLRVNGMDSESLRQWLAQARQGARAQVTQVSLTPAGPGLWSGQISLVLRGGA